MVINTPVSLVTWPCLHHGMSLSNRFKYAFADWLARWFLYQMRTGPAPLRMLLFLELCAKWHSGIERTKHGQVLGLCNFERGRKQVFIGTTILPFSAGHFPRTSPKVHHIIWQSNILWKNSSPQMYRSLLPFSVEVGGFWNGEQT